LRDVVMLRRSTQLTPTAIAAPKSFSPSATATTSSATIVKEKACNGVGSADNVQDAGLFEWV
jgi:hypothetical protein